MYIENVNSLAFNQEGRPHHAKRVIRRLRVVLTGRNQFHPGRVDRLDITGVVQFYRQSQ